jgi:hypothetical protein
MRIRDPGWRQFGSGIPGWKKVGSGINIPDPQHCLLHTFGTGVGALPCFTISYDRRKYILGLYKVDSVPFCLFISKSQAFASTIMVSDLDAGSGACLTPRSGILDK